MILKIRNKKKGILRIGLLEIVLTKILKETLKKIKKEIVKKRKITQRYYK